MSLLDLVQAAVGPCARKSTLTRRKPRDSTRGLWSAFSWLLPAPWPSLSSRKPSNCPDIHNAISRPSYGPTSSSGWPLQSCGPVALLFICLFFFFPVIYCASIPPIMQGGPGQALAFYGTQSTAVFPLTNISAVDDAFTLEFWVMPTCSQLGCSFFTLQSENYSEYVQKLRD